MKKNTKFFLAFIAWMLSLATMAQITGETCITTDGATYQYEVNLGGKSFNQTSAEVTTWGGIEVVSVDREQNKILIKSKQGTTKEEYFSKFGKGRIWVTYQDGGCGNWMSFDVSKSFDMQNDNEYGYTIVSPSCISAGDTMTVAVTPLVTMAFPHSPMERYKWSFPNGLIREVLFAAVDSSAITFVAGQIGVIETISVKLGQCNFSNPNNLLTRKVYNSPPKPIIEGDICTKWKAGAEYQIKNISSNANYTWFINGDSLAQGTSFKLDEYKKFAVNGEIKLMVEANPIGGSCLGTLVDTLVVKKGFNRNISKIVSNKECFSVGDEINLSILDGLTNSVDWEFPKHWKKEKINGYTSVRINIPNSAKLRETIMAYVGSVSCSDTLLYNFNIKPGKVDSVLGARTIFTDNTYTYTVQNTLMPTMNKGYEWVLPAGLEELSRTHNSITVKVKSERASLTPFTVTAIGNEGCNSEVTNIVVGYEPQPVGEITASTSCFNINMPTSVSFSVVPIAGHSFVWTVDSELGVFDTHTSGNVLSGTVLGIPGTYKVTCQSKSGNNISSHIEEYQVVIDSAYKLNLSPGFYGAVEVRLYNNNEIVKDIKPSSFKVEGTYNGMELKTDIFKMPLLVGALLSTFADSLPRGIYFPIRQGFILEYTYTFPTNSDGCINKLYKKVVGTAPAPNQGNSTNSSRSNNFESKRSSENRTLIFDENLFDLYPNPTDEFVNVSMKQYDSSINTDVEIYNTDGKIVYKGKIKDSNMKINIKEISPSTYLMMIRTSKVYKVLRFIKQ